MSEQAEQFGVRFDITDGAARSHMKSAALEILVAACDDTIEAAALAPLDVYVHSDDTTSMVGGRLDVECRTNDSRNLRAELSEQQEIVLLRAAADAVSNVYDDFVESDHFRATSIRHSGQNERWQVIGHFEREVATDGGHRKVWYAAQGNSGVSRIYHTDPDCVRLQRARKIHSTTEDQLEDRRSECGTCEGGIEQSDPDWSYQNALRNADVDDGRGLETDGGQREVYFAAGRTNGSLVWHDDSDCRALKTANTVHSRPLEAISERRERCQYCAGYNPAPTEQDHSHRRFLKEADPEVLPDGGQITTNNPMERLQQVGLIGPDGESDVIGTTKVRHHGSMTASVPSLALKTVGEDLDELGLRVEDRQIIVKEPGPDDTWRCSVTANGESTALQANLPKGPLQAIGAHLEYDILWRDRGDYVVAEVAEDGPDIPRMPGGGST